MDTLGGAQDMVFLTEAGVYKMLFKSRKEIAVTFQDWVCQVIKEIRLTGKYELQKTLEHEKSSIREQTLLDSYHKKPVVYLGNVGIIEGDELVKFGYTNDIQSRTKDHKREIGEFYRLEYIVECEQNIDLEKKLKKHNDISNRRVTREINGKVQTELIRLDQHLKIGDVQKIATTLKQTVFIDKEYATMKHKEKMEEEMTKQKELETKQREIEKEVKRMDFELEMKRLEIQYLSTLQNLLDHNTDDVTEAPTEPLSCITPATTNTNDPSTSLTPETPETPETLKSNILEYIEEECDFDRYNTEYRMSSEDMFHSFRKWRDTKYPTEHFEKEAFKDIIKDITGTTVKIAKVRIGGHKVAGWYGLRYKTD